MDGALADDSRPCVSCHSPPAAEGYDACLGRIEGVKSACCGHGVEPPYSVAVNEALSDQQNLKEISQ